MRTLFLICLLALPAGASELELAWALSAPDDGASGGPEGTLDVEIRQPAADLHVVEALAELRASGRGGFRWPWQPRRPDRLLAQRLTATRLGFAEPAVHAVTVVEGRTTELQARVESGRWRVSVQEPAGARVRTFRPDEVDLSWVDLLDPERGARVPELESDRIGVLDLVSGERLEAYRVLVGPESLTLDGAPLAVERWEIRFTGAAAPRPWVLWYGPAGHLVQFEVALGDRAVRGLRRGGPPPVSDDFALPDVPDIEIVD